MREGGAAIRERALGLLERQDARARDVLLLQIDEHQRLDDRRVDVSAQIDDGAHARGLILLWTGGQNGHGQVWFRNYT